MPEGERRNMRNLLSGQRWGCWLQIFGILLIVLLLSVVIIWIGGDRLVELSKVLQGQGRVVDNISINVDEARRTHAVEYAKVHITTWVKGTETKDPFGLLKSDRILIVSGTCVAGMDYDKKSEDFQIQGQSVIVTLPSAELLRCGVDDATFIDAGGLIPASTDMNNDLLRNALKKIEQTAYDQDILKLAEQQAETVEELTLRRLGFTTVKINILPAPAPAK